MAYYVYPLPDNVDPEQYYQPLVRQHYAPNVAPPFTQLNGMPSLLIKHPDPHSSTRSLGYEEALRREREMYDRNAALTRDFKTPSFLPPPPPHQFEEHLPRAKEAMRQNLSLVHMKYTADEADGLPDVNDEPNQLRDFRRVSAGHIDAKHTTIANVAYAIDIPSKRSRQRSSTQVGITHGPQAYYNHSSSKKPHEDKQA